MDFLPARFSSEINYVVFESTQRASQEAINSLFTRMKILNELLNLKSRNEAAKRSFKIIIMTHFELF